MEFIFQWKCLQCISPCLISEIVAIELETYSIHEKGIGHSLKCNNNTLSINKYLQKNIVRHRPLYTTSPTNDQTPTQAHQPITKPLHNLTNQWPNPLHKLTNQWPNPYTTSPNNDQTPTQPHQPMTKPLHKLTNQWPNPYVTSPTNYQPPKQLRQPMTKSLHNLTR